MNILSISDTVMSQKKRIKKKRQTKQVKCYFVTNKLDLWEPPLSLWMDDYRQESFFKLINMVSTACWQAHWLT